MAASTAMLGRDQPAAVYTPRSGRKGSARRPEARVAQEWGVDMARVTPRVAGEDYGVSSIPSHPPVVHVPEDVGLSARAMQGPPPRQVAQPPTVQRAPAGTTLASRVGVGQPHPPAEPHPGRKPPQREQSISEFVDSVAPKIDVGGLTMDIMMPIYSQLEKKAMEAERRAEEAADTIAALEKKKDKLMSRMSAETEARTKNDAKVWRLAQDLIKAQTAAEHAEASLEDANNQLEAKERVLTDQEQRLLRERGDHRRTQRNLDRNGRDLAAANARIEAKEKEVRPLQLQNLEMAQKLEEAQQSVAKLERNFSALTSKHEELTDRFSEQSGALRREREAREDAQECEAQIRILLEDEVDKKGSTREQLRQAKAQIQQLQSDLQQSKLAEGLARKDHNQALDDLELERAAHGGSKEHLHHTTGSLKTMQTVEGALRAEIASARARIDGLTEENDALLNTMGIIQQKVDAITSWLNRGQRVGKQASQLDGSFGDDVAQNSLSQPAPESPRASADSPRAPVSSPRGSTKVRVFKHSANLVEVERTGLLKELAVVTSLLTLPQVEDTGPTDEEIQAIVRPVLHIWNSSLWISFCALQVAMALTPDVHCSQELEKAAEAAWKQENREPSDADKLKKLVHTLRQQLATKEKQLQKLESAIESLRNDQESSITQQGSDGA